MFPTVGKLGRGVTWRDPRNVSSELLALRRAAGIDWPMTSHTFRKTAANYSIVGADDPTKPLEYDSDTWTPPGRWTAGAST